METKRSKTVFIEYSSSEKGQHFMTVVQITDRERQIIGRIFRDYDNDSKKTQYRAVDWAGNQVFVDTKDISALKKNFIECGKQMAMDVPKNPNHRVQNGRVPSPDKPYRLHELKKIREPKIEKKTKGQKLEKTDKNEKSVPEMNDRDKELQQIRQPESKPEVEKEQETEDVSGKSERDKELEEIRDTNDENDREQDEEVEIDI
jgi:hypothetical protein